MPSHNFIFKERSLKQYLENLFLETAVSPKLQESYS
jgi:hypothetical protein